MNYNIIPTEYFAKVAKPLAKKYPSFKADLGTLINDLAKQPMTGIDLGGGFRKIRMAITSKNKGKSGGARVITYTVMISLQNTDVFLVTIYDKGEKENIPVHELQKIVNNEMNLFKNQ